MNKPLSVKLTRYCLLIRGITCWFITSCALSVFSTPCLAQINGNDRATQLYKSSWRTPYEPKSTYLIHVEALQHQLRYLLKPLSHLSVVDPPVYSLLQENLHTYLRQLHQEGADYGKATIYQAVQLQFILFEERIKDALAENRRIVYEEGFTSPKTRQLTKGVQLTVRPYALVFKKPDYRSALRHTILPKETVTVLKDEGTYCKVKCALHKGYVSKGMILNDNP